MSEAELTVDGSEARQIGGRTLVGSNASTGSRTVLGGVMVTDPVHSSMSAHERRDGSLASMRSVSPGCDSIPLHRRE